MCVVALAAAAAATAVGRKKPTCKNKAPLVLLCLATFISSFVVANIKTLRHVIIRVVVSVCRRPTVP